MPKKSTKPKKKPRVLTLAWVRKNVAILKELGEGLTALAGKKPLRSKVAILANPDKPQSMSILTRGQARYVTMAKYVEGVHEWGGIFEGLGQHSDQVMSTSPSLNGLGREQVIRLIGAISESKLLQQLGVTVKQKDKE